LLKIEELLLGGKKMSWSETEFERRQTGQERTVVRRMPTPPEKDEHGCIIGKEEWNPDLHQCVKITKHTPTREQIPAQPVVPVGPVTIEQKVAALNDKLAKFEQLLANLYGLVGQNYEEAQQALVWHLGK
jgi:hypothetical protein